MVTSNKHKQPYSKKRTDTQTAPSQKERGEDVWPAGKKETNKQRRKKEITTKRGKKKKKRKEEERRVGCFRVLGLFEPFLKLVLLHGIPPQQRQPLLHALAGGLQAAVLGVLRLPTAGGAAGWKPVGNPWKPRHLLG